jgi:hypothetical protein
VLNSASSTTRFVSSLLGRRAPAFRTIEGSYTTFTSLLTNTYRSASTANQQITLDVNPVLLSSLGFTLGARVMTQNGSGRFMGVGIDEESFDSFSKRIEKERTEKEKKKDGKDSKETKTIESKGSSRSNDNRALWINLDTEGPTMMRRSDILDITKEKEKPKRDVQVAAAEALSSLPTLTSSSSPWRLREAIQFLQLHQTALAARLAAPPASKDKADKDKDSSSPPSGSPTSSSSSSSSAAPTEKPGLLTRAFSGLLSGRWASSVSPAELEEKKAIEEVNSQVTSLLTKLKEYLSQSLKGMREDELDAPWTVSRYKTAMESDQWTLARDIELVAMVNHISSTTNVPPQLLIATDFSDEVRALSTFRSLQQFSHVELLARFALLLDFNTRVATVLPHIRHGTLGYRMEADHWSVASRLREGRDLMFQSVKQKAWDEALRATTTHSRPPNRDVLMGACSGLIDVEFNRNLAKEAKEGSRTREQKLTQLLFGQAEGLLDDNEPDKLRRAYVKPPLFEPFDLQKRTFMVKFTGEEAHDEGGPYRACFHDWIAYVLCSSFVSLSTSID